MEWKWTNCKCRCCFKDNASENYVKCDVDLCQKGLQDDIVKGYYRWGNLHIPHWKSLSELGHPPSFPFWPILRQEVHTATLSPWFFHSLFPLCRTLFISTLLFPFPFAIYLVSLEIFPPSISWNSPEHPPTPFSFAMMTRQISVRSIVSSCFSV